MPISTSPVMEKDDEPLLAAVDVVAAPAADGAAEAAAIDATSALPTTPFASPSIGLVPLINPEAPPHSALPSDTATATRRAASTSMSTLPPPPAALARAASAAAAAAAASSAAAVASSSAAASSLASSSGVSSFEHTHLATYLVLCFAVACVMHDSMQVRGRKRSDVEAREKQPGREWRASRGRPFLRHTGVGASSKGKNSQPHPPLLPLLSLKKTKTRITQGILQKYELNRKWYLLYGELAFGGRKRKRGRESESAGSSGAPFFFPKVQKLFLSPSPSRLSSKKLTQQN